MTNGSIVQTIRLPFIFCLALAPLHEMIAFTNLIVGIVSVYDEQINWYGAHFYVGGKSDKYEDRADLSINGYRLSDKELREFMEGKRLKKWYNKESLKYKEAQ